MDNTERSDAADSAAGPPVSIEDASDLDALVANADAVLVEFYTDGCGICASMEPVLSNLSRDLDIAIGLVNPRDDPPLVERFDVRSVPLFVLFVDGEPVARRAEGFIPGEELSEWVRKWLD